MECNFVYGEVNYFNHSQVRGKAGDCIGCQRCETLCRQHIEITKHLKEILQAS
jgi:predicted aldo/keto reductase-like oxidoreductase